MEAGGWKIRKFVLYDCFLSEIGSKVTEEREWAGTGS